jgi:hypothetical protein
MLLAIQSFNDNYCTGFNFKASYFDSKMTALPNVNKDKTVDFVILTFLLLYCILRQIFLNVRNIEFFKAKIYSPYEFLHIHISNIYCLIKSRNCKHVPGTRPSFLRTAATSLSLRSSCDATDARRCLCDAEYCWERRRKEYFSPGTIIKSSFNTYFR